MWLKLLLSYNRIYDRIDHIRGTTRLKKILRNRAIDQVAKEKEGYYQAELYDGTIKMGRWIDFWFIEEKEVLDLFTQDVREGDVVVDVGANIGAYTVLAGLKRADVFSFEMDPKNLEILKKNIELNNLDVDVNSKAVLSESGTIQATLEGSGGSNVREGDEEVETVSLDGYLNEKLDVVKIDVEGAEMDVLKGMEEIMDESSPIIYVEVHTNEIRDMGYTAEELERFLREKGYNLQKIEDRPSVYNLRCKK